MAIGLLITGNYTHSVDEVDIKNAEINEEEFNYNLINENMEKSGVQHWYANSDALLYTLFSSKSFEEWFCKSNLYELFLNVLSSEQTGGIYSLMYGTIPLSNNVLLRNDLCKLPEYTMDNNSIFLRLTDTAMVVQLLLGIGADDKIFNLLQEFKRIGNNKNIGIFKVFAEIINILGEKAIEIKMRQLKEEAAVDGLSNITQKQYQFKKNWKYSITRGITEVSILWSNNFFMTDCPMSKLFNVVTSSKECMKKFSSRIFVYFLHWWQNSIKPLCNYHIKQFEYLFGIFHFIHVLFDTMKNFKTSIKDSMAIVEQKMVRQHCHGINKIDEILHSVFDNSLILNETIDDIGEEELLNVLTNFIH